MITTNQIIQRNSVATKLLGFNQVRISKAVKSLLCRYYIKPLHFPMASLTHLRAKFNFLRITCSYKHKSRQSMILYILSILNAHFLTVILTNSGYNQTNITHIRKPKFTQEMQVNLIYISQHILFSNQFYTCPRKDNRP